jgi:hypothetical protein
MLALGRGSQATNGELRDLDRPSGRAAWLPKGR